ncbi:non-homologous end-joining DNA ligase [Thermosulfuriphilus sp.]
MSARLPERLKPMLAHLSQPFDSPDYLYEIKWDGSRCLFFIEKGRLRLQNRRLSNITYRYPEFEHLPLKIPADGVVFDGEIVVLKNGIPHFLSLQEREHTLSRDRIRLLSRYLPATYMVFDLLYLNFEPLLERPLIDRKEFLKKVLPEDPQLVESSYVFQRGQSFFEAACRKGFEGVMAKKITSPYLPGQRSHYWLKFKPRKKSLCFIIGYLLNNKGELKSLLIAEETEKGFRFRGRVGSGLGLDEQKRILKLLKSLPEIEHPRFAPRISGAHWVRPELRCLVSYQEVTNQGRFRAPVFEGLLE